MKQVLLSFLFCCFGFVALSQPTTIRIYATGAAGSFTTGSSTVAIRTEGDIIATNYALIGVTRGYSVFDLDSIPSTATVTSVVTQFHVYSYGGATVTPLVWNTYGYAGDLSTVTSAPVLFANMVAGTSLTTASYGTAAGNQTLATTGPAVTFVQANIGNKVSWCYTHGNNRAYYITGQAGPATTTVGHAPYLEVTYTCAGISGVTATATPNPVCPGNTFTLTATGTGTATYTWAGPSGYAHTGMSATLTATTTTPDVYTLTATTPSGCKVITTTTVNKGTPPTITTTPAGLTSVCEGSTLALAGSPAGGTWGSSASTIATVNATSGVVSGIAQGVTNITYTNIASPFCWSVMPVSVNASPAAILPTSPRVCVGSTLALTNSSTGGAWSIAPTTVATVSATGVVTGLLAGTATVTYNNTCGTPATTVITVDPLPSSITGPTSVCEWGGTITLSDATAGGSWSGGSPNASASTFSSTQGIVTGINDGTATVTYTSLLSCSTTYTVTVNPAPNPITGALKQCVGTVTTLSNSIPGGTWSSSTPSAIIAPAPYPPGVFAGAVAGYSVISYTNACGTVTAMDTVVGIPPAFIGGDTVCLGGTLVLADSVIGGTWSSSDPLIASVLTGSGVVTGVSLGLVTITYTVPPGCAVTGNVRVIDGPPAITGTTEVCPGRTTALSNASPGGTWFSGSPAVATVGATSGVVTGITSATAMITYTDSNACQTSTMVIVNPVPPAIVGDSIICASLVDTMYNSAIGGTWSSATPGIASVGATTGIVTTLSGGVAIIRYTFTGTGCYTSKTLTVHPAPSPIVTYNYFTNTFEAPPGYLSYQWYNTADGIIPAAITPTTAAQVFSSYYVVVMDSNGCVGQSANIPYTSSMLGVNNTKGNSCRIHPNPANGTLYIDASTNVTVVISDMAGRKEIETKSAKQIDISKLANGLYLVSVYDEKGTLLTIEKLVKN